jgi:hypothetical protein
MSSENEKRFTDITQKFNSEFSQKWLRLLEYVLPETDFIEFNVFEKKTQLDSFINKWHSEFIEKGQDKKKIYSHGEFIRFRLSKEFREVIKSQGINSWRNYGLEDISFYRSETELLAVISHENYIYLLANNAVAEALNKECDFSFEIDLVP